MVVVDLQWPNSGFGNEDIRASAKVSASKLEGEHAATAELFAAATTITALASRILHTVRGATGTLLSFEGVIITAATGSDRTVSVDLEKSSGGAAFASICTTKIEITNSTTIRVPVAAVLSSTTLVDGDTLRAVVTVAGSLLAQALGLSVTLHWREDAA